jgi:hypothetical protein
MKTKQLMDLIALGEVAGQPESTPHVGAHEEAHDTLYFVKLQQSKQERP